MNCSDGDSYLGVLLLFLMVQWFSSVAYNLALVFCLHMQENVCCLFF